MTTSLSRGLQRLSTLVGCIIYMMFLGTPYIVGSIAPYLGSYYQVSPQQTQVILPSLIVINTLVIPFGS
jgi:hypothetical protein